MYSKLFEMGQVLERAIFLLVRILLFFIPIILLPYTSELFEFNKIVAVYILTSLIVAAWLAKMLLAKKIIFRRTILDIPLLLFLFSQLVSTIFSFDARTSFLGYYSRFNGGLASSISYSLLYWAWVSNIGAKKTLSALRFLLVSAFLVSVYGILEHFGIDKDIWVQDVAQRVFSTLGQPNWLAAWLVGLIPLTWAFIPKEKGTKVWFFLALSVIFFLTLLFTKSRSGLIGFAAASLAFWPFVYWGSRKKSQGVKGFVKKFVGINSLFLILVVTIGTPWSPNIFKIVRGQATLPQLSFQGPALEVGGTDSGKIRKIVWRGAIEIWKHYPLFGTGVETFAYSYYNYRPIEHNLVSEWDFLYNKAHNEYLNFLATTGTFGTATYLILIGFSVAAILAKKKILNIALLSGYISLLVTNFFGFSVVPTALEFFLFPAIAIAISSGKPDTEKSITARLNTSQKAGLLVLLGISGYLLISIFRYWYADSLFAQGKTLNDKGGYVNARQALVKAVKLSPHESIFWDELSQSTTGIAVALSEAKEDTKAGEFALEAIKESSKGVSLSPKNVNLKRNATTMYIKLSPIEPGYLQDAIAIINESLALAPTDAKLVYNLGLTYLRTGEEEEALLQFEKAIAMKPNYRDARLAYALTLADKGQKQKAIEELGYILTRIDPNDSIVQAELEKLTKKSP